MVVLDVGAQGCIEQLGAVEGEIVHLLVLYRARVMDREEVGQVLLVSVATSVHYLPSLALLFSLLDIIPPDQVPKRNTSFYTKTRTVFYPTWNCSGQSALYCNLT